MINTNFKFFFLGLVFLLLSSCVKNTDFSQSEEIFLSPVVELNLIYFDIEAPRFFDIELGEEILTVQDTTVVDFLDGDDTANVLKRMQLYFDFKNSIPRNFDIKFQFLTRDNEPTYATSTRVSSGIGATSVQTIFIEDINPDEIEQLTMSKKVVSIVTIPASEQSLVGTLNLKSKATYYIEIKL